MEKALIAMSGGVDSSVAAYLIQKQGIPCLGGTMLLWDTDPASLCDARSVAEKLGMELTGQEGGFLHFRGEISRVPIF